MHYTIIENQYFLSNYILELVFALTLLALSIYVYYKYNKEKKLFAFSIFLLFLFVSLVTVLPKTLDLRAFLTHDYEVQQGILEDYEIKSYSNHGKTAVVFDDNIYYIDGSHILLEDYKKMPLTVYYLKYSMEVVKIDWVYEDDKDKSN